MTENAKKEDLQYAYMRIEVMRAGHGFTEKEDEALQIALDAIANVCALETAIKKLAEAADIANATNARLVEQSNRHREAADRFHDLLEGVVINPGMSHEEKEHVRGVFGL